MPSIRSTEVWKLSYDAVVFAVGHEQFRTRGATWLRGLLREGGVLFDVKSLLPADAVDGRL